MLKTGTISEKNHRKWSRLVYYFNQKHEILPPLLRNNTSVPPFIKQRTKTPEIINKKETEHQIHKIIENPTHTRNLTKKGFHIYKELLQLKTKRISYLATYDGIVNAPKIRKLRSKGYSISYVIGVGKNGDNPHTHLLITPAKGKRKNQMLKDTKPFNFSYNEPVKHFEATCAYLAQNYDERAKKGILSRGTRRFSIGQNTQRLSKEEKKYLHPRRTRAEMIRWEKSTEICRNNNKINMWGRKHWVYHKREEIREIAEQLPLDYSYNLYAVSKKDGHRYDIQPSLARGGNWVTWNSKKKIYDLEVNIYRPTTPEESSNGIYKQIMHSLTLTQTIKDFGIGNHFEWVKNS